MIALKNVLLKVEDDRLNEHAIPLVQCIQEVVGVLIGLEWNEKVLFYIVLETLWVTQLVTCGDTKLVNELVREKSTKPSLVVSLLLKGLTSDTKEIFNFALMCIGNVIESPKNA